MSTETITSSNPQTHTFTVVREYDADLELVWKAHTSPEMLDQWWGPKPWRAKTSSLELRPGGHWVYCMVGPQDEHHWATMEYITIDPLKSFEAVDSFTDEHGTVNPELPISKGRMSFTNDGRYTRVEWTSVYQSAEDLQTILSMGMEQGIRICIDQLVALLATLQQH